MRWRGARSRRGARSAPTRPRNTTKSAVATGILLSKLPLLRTLGASRAACMTRTGGLWGRCIPRASDLRSTRQGRSSNGRFQAVCRRGRRHHHSRCARSRRAAGHRGAAREAARAGSPARDRATLVRLGRPLPRRRRRAVRADPLGADRRRSSTVALLIGALRAHVPAASSRSGAGVGRADAADPRPDVLRAPDRLGPACRGSRNPPAGALRRVRARGTLAPGAGVRPRRRTRGTRSGRRSSSGWPASGPPSLSHWPRVHRCAAGAVRRSTSRAHGRSASGPRSACRRSIHLRAMALRLRDRPRPRAGRASRSRSRAGGIAWPAFCSRCRSSCC